MNDAGGEKTRVDSDLALANVPTEALASVPEAAANPDVIQYRFGDIVQERYEIREQLGKGGFGAVYAAFDRSLKRVVAIKQSSGLRSFRSGQVRDEARAVASLNHPNIVQIHDLIQVESNQLLIVMECLNGLPLSKQLHQARLNVSQSVKIAMEIANALIHAHEKHLVHSDLKPANIFLCATDTVKLLDFGLAVVYSPGQSNGPIGGTPGYMSPEQSRGESHLIDGRSDIWSLGVVLYEMLTGNVPFSKHINADFRQGKLGQSVAPLRQLNPEVDGELQRIVMKCLEPLIKQRYGSASELLEDLQGWFGTFGQVQKANTLIQPHPMLPRISEPATRRIGNRGLQPFTELDGEAYLPLAPGQRDRNGVPESINFWKRWTESNDPEFEHPVGILYGPSGSGKTSYVRAGLFPRLSPGVCRVYIESRPGNLAERLTRIIELQIQNDSGESSLRDLLHRLRSGHSSHRFQKLLIVLDQFEAWASSATLEERLNLAEALRQCDGRNIRALVVTRVDFWSGAAELLHWLEIPIQEGRNVAAVQLLAPDEAHQILESVGRDAGILPPENQLLSTQQRQFITEAIDELTVNGAVICIHLVMFAQMVKFLKWTPRALRDAGGVSGACSLFLQELFGSSERRSPEYQRVSAAAEVILNQLVPDGERRVADVVVDRTELQLAVARAGHAHQFDDCLRLLCEDLRIIASVGNDGNALENEGSQQTDSRTRNTTRYRLAHDFLVEPVSTFLSRMRQRSWSGRASSRLSELSSDWDRRPHPAHLPAFGEYLSLVFSGFFQHRNAAESRFLRAATRRHAGKISVTTLSILTICALSLFAWNRWSAAAAAERRELVVTVDAYFNGADEDLPSGIASLEKLGGAAVDEVENWKDSVDPEVQLRAQIFLQNHDPTTFAALAPLLSHAAVDWFDDILAIADKVPDAPESLKATIASNVDERNSNRAAILLANLGDSSALFSRLAGSNDATKDNNLLTEATKWGHNAELWAAVLDAAQEPAIVYHAAVVLATFAPESIKATGIDLTRLLNSPDVTSMNSARYLANHMGQDVLSIPPKPPENANWKLGPDNVPMALIQPASLSYAQATSGLRVTESQLAKIEVDRAFWMATVPVTQRLYAEFVSQTPTLPDGSPSIVVLEEFKVPDYLVDTPDQPMVGTNLAQAYNLCNYLSRQAGLQECYSPRDVEPVVAERDEFTLEPVPWTFEPIANGFRVPTSQEMKLSAQCTYERGLPWQHTLDLPRAGNMALNTNFPLPMLQIAPSRFGVFVFQSIAWTSGNDNFTSLSIVSNGYRPWVTTKQLGAPNAVIFLAQNAN